MVDLHCEQESAIACLVREAREEAGLQIDPDDVEFAHAVHLLDAPGTQPRMQLVFRARRWRGTPAVLEPGKCLSWDWWHPHALPEPIVGYTRAAIDGIQVGRPYSEIGWVLTPASPAPSVRSGRFLCSCPKTLCPHR